MGAAARKIAPSVAPARPELRLVPATRGRSRARSHRTAQNLFRISLVCFIALALTGAARVALAAQAAEASMNAWDLRAEVKAETLVGRTLEADRSALAAPSRIEAVASQTLNMGRPAEVSYLQLPPSTQEAPSAAAPAALAATGESGPGLLATVMDLAADEAQVLLVGNVGLGSLR